MSKQVLISENSFPESNLSNRHHNDLFGDSDHSTGNGTEANDQDFLNNANSLDEDIYDFSNLRPSLHLESENNNHTDEEEEEDINFDYEYGYDYERIIKDRLKKANQEFMSDSNPPKRKSILVSFDKEVTAIDIPNGNETESEDGKKVSIQQSDTVNEDKNDTKSISNDLDNHSHQVSLENKHSAANAENIVRLPLNDTVEKENPNAFADRIKEAVQKYDAEMNERLLAQQEQERVLIVDENHNYQNNSQNQQPKANGELSQNFLKKELVLNLIPNSSATTENSNNNNKNNSSQIKNSNDDESFNSISSPSPPPANSSPDLNSSSKNQIQQKNKNDEKKTKNKKKVSTKTVSISPSPTSSPTHSSIKTNQDIIQTENKIQSIKLTSSSPTQPPSFSASSRLNEASPSPISSVASSPRIEKIDSPFMFSSAPANNKSEPGDNEALKSNNQKENDFKNEPVNESKNEEKMLVEKDGVFKLMSPEEYTAYEKQKKEEMKKKEQNSNNGNKLISSYLVPHRPNRPKTSINSNSNNRSMSLKTRFILNANRKSLNIENNSPKSKTSSDQHLNEVKSLRVSHSADPNGRRNENNSKNSSLTRLHRQTPDYAQHYKSPYQAAFKIQKSAESAEEKQKREREEEERRRNNELAFKEWLKQKDEQEEKRLQEEKQRKNRKETDKKFSPENSSSTANTDDTKNTFEVWLLRKKDQQEREKEFKRTMEKISICDKQCISPEERSKAFRDWVNKKLREKNEAIKLEKLENKKWMARRRRSRKHQRLSQAIEMAQAYGYGSSFYSPGVHY